MKRANALVVACALVVLVGALPVAVTSAGSASTTAITLGDSATVTDDSGEQTVTMTVRADATGVRGYQANVTFDPSVVQVQSVSKSEDFAKPVANVNNEAGWVSFNQIRSSETDGPALATITFTVTGDAGASTEISFVEEDTKFADGSGETFSPQAYNGVEVTVDDSTPTSTPNGTSTVTSTPNGTATPNTTATPNVTSTPNTTSTPNGTSTATSTPTDTPSSTPTSTETSEDGGDGDAVADEANSGGNGGNDNVNSGGGGGGDVNSGGDDDDDDDGGDAGGGGDSGSVSTGEPSLAVTNVTLNTSSPVEGRPVTVSAVVENTGDADGKLDTQVYVDENATEANRTVEVAAGEQREVNFSLQFDSPGTHTVAVGNASVGNVSVQAANATDTPSSTATEASPETADSTVTQSATATSAEESPASAATETVTESTSGEETSGSVPGFGFGITVGTLVTLAGWAGMRRRRDT
ncbi:cohesin domain-containing protein [Halopelagius longus]|uniref:Cohesin domain-containing protein n=1 Tax=Halopelagius longus TaxID=1236180 RepID=A0A1H1GJF9_9EURY|nr:cohesin domain-containing protein [Halopelagius longus]RDI69704.1 hypothetical protein DWB78_18205 [Halopelagius longus]SDR13330.1 Cohesin domain-containing protein [Halopelagius longus]